MNVVPICFAFDNNIVKAACVCMTSLLENAEADTFYDIFILHSQKENLDKSIINKVQKLYNNCRIEYIEVDNTFCNAFEIRGVTVATYYRLLLSKLINKYDKVIYSDVDMIFRLDLKKIYNINMTDYYVAATLDLGLNFLDTRHILESPELDIGNYLQAGFMIFNLKKIREDNLSEKFIEYANKHKYTYQDQDVLNICCKGKVKYLSPCYNVNDCSFLVLRTPEKLAGLFSIEECEFARNFGNIHFSGKKPWKENSICMDLWWEYYRKSPVYDVDEYFDFFFNKTLFLDTLSLWERIRNLLRFFVYGQSKV